MSITVTGFCHKCKCSVELEKEEITLDNKSKMILLSGTCPVCGKEIVEEEF